MDGLTTTVKLAEGICGLLCSGGEMVWAGVSPSEAFMTAMMKEAESCMGNLVSILNDFERF